MQGKLELLKIDGSKESYDVLSSFVVKNKDSEKTYILITANEVDQNGLIKILASQVVDNKLVKIESDDDWMTVKNVMRAIISSSKGDFTYCNLGDNLNYTADAEFARIIAIQDVAKQQLIKDFTEKKPKIEETKVEEIVADPNAGIYPEQPVEKTEELTDNGSAEIIPGISELTEEKVEPAKVEEPVSVPEPAPLANEIINNPTDEEPVINVEFETVNEPPVPATVNVDEAKKIMVDKIVAAVDEYISKVYNKDNNIEINALKTSITEMENKLSQINAALKG